MSNRLYLNQIVNCLIIAGAFEMLADKKSQVSPEIFRGRLRNYPNWEKSSQSDLAVKFLEKRRQRLAQMTEADIQYAELSFERFKVSINSDRPDDAKLYL